MSVIGVTPLSPNPNRPFKAQMPQVLQLRVGDSERRVILKLGNTTAATGNLDEIARAFLWRFRTYEALPQHVTPLEVGFILCDGEIGPLAEAIDFFLIEEFAEGETYMSSLEDLADQWDDGSVALAVDRVRMLASYLAQIHATVNSGPHAYLEAIRLWRNRFIALLDFWPKGLILQETDLKWLDEKALEWHWRMKHLGRNAAQIHGDFHPYNVIFSRKRAFQVLDREPPLWGEPALDLAAMAINYALLAMRLPPSSPTVDLFLRLIQEFLTRYTSQTGDEMILCLLPPFLASFALVLGNPAWYPFVSSETRSKLGRFAIEVSDQSNLTIDWLLDYLVL